MLEEKILALIPPETVPFIGDLPSQRTNSTAITIYTGDQATEFFGATSQSILKPNINVTVRNTNYQTAQKWVDIIQNKLHRYYDDYFLGIIMQGSPIYLGRTSDKINEFQMSFKIMIRSD